MYFDGAREYNYHTDRLYPLLGGVQVIEELEGGELCLAAARAIRDGEVSTTVNAINEVIFLAAETGIPVMEHGCEHPVESRREEDV